MICRPVPKEGRFAIVTNAGRDAVDASGATDESAELRTAKSCGPGAPTLALSFVEMICEATVAKEPGHRGEHEVSRKPLRGESRSDSAEPVCSCAFSYVHLHARPRVQRAPGFPCALYLPRG
jgi:hypothetical protein